MITFGLAPGRLADGCRVYAIGDVHGCADRLVRLHEAIAEDLSARPAGQAAIVHLGDYVDRGPDSAGVVRHLAGGLPGMPRDVAVVNLMGNHEDMMLAALADPSGAASHLWLFNGGVPTLRSWGVPAGARPAEWAARLRPGDLAFLRGLASCHRIGGYLFVHAGLRPGTPLALQDRQDMLWIREPFLDWTGDFDPGAPGLVVVHGHTPTHDPVVRPNRIGIDTGAVMGGALTCAVLEADRLGFIAT
jgi:serine/threonine protein phosphatase 1